MKILAIETSGDETSASVLENGKKGWKATEEISNERKI